MAAKGQKAEAEAAEGKAGKKKGDKKKDEKPFEFRDGKRRGPQNPPGG